MAKLKRIRFIKLPNHTPENHKKIVIIDDDVFVLSTMIDSHIHAPEDHVIYFSDAPCCKSTDKEYRYVSLDYLCNDLKLTKWIAFKNVLFEGE